MATSVQQQKARSVPYLQESGDSKGKVKQKTNQVANQAMQPSSSKLCFPPGPFETLFSFLPFQTMIELTSVNRTMMEIAQRNLTCATAHTEQLEWRNLNGLPVSYKGHYFACNIARQELTDSGYRFPDLQTIRYSPSPISAAAFTKELEARSRCGIPTSYADHQKLLRLCLGERLSSNIHHIDFSDRPGIDNEEFQQIVKLYPNLRNVTLKQTQITNEGFALLKSLPLEELTLIACSDIEAFDFSTGFTSLKRLVLKYLYIGDVGLASLVGCPYLTSLSLISSSNIKGDGFNPLADAQIPLTELDLGFLELNDAGFAAIGRFPSLRRLSLRSCDAQDEKLAHLRGLGLAYLNLEANFKITDVGVRFITGLPLEELNLFACYNITDEGCASLKVLHPTLKTLNISASRISDRVLNALSKSLSLTSLNLAECNQLTDQGIQSLKLLPLNDLKLSGCSQVTDEGFQVLGTLPLESLEVAGCEISERSFIPLAIKLSLKELNISNCANLRDSKKGSPSDKSDNIRDALRLLPLKLLVISNDIGPKIHALREEIPGLKMVSI